MINITTGDDIYARYKRPTLQIKVQGRGSNTDTIITNTNDIVKSLNIEPSMLTHFYGKKLCTRSSYKAKETQIVSHGQHSMMDLSVILNNYIDIFVLCDKCKLPETHLVVTKKSVKLNCDACGHLHKIHGYEFITDALRAQKKSPKSTKRKTSESKESNKVSTAEIIEKCDLIGWSDDIKSTIDEI